MNNNSNGEKKKKFNWIKLVILILVFALVGVGVYFIFFRKTNSKSFNQFENRLVIDSKKNDDSDYIKDLKFDQQYLKIYVTEEISGSSESYVVFVPDRNYLSDFRGYLNGSKAGAEHVGASLSKIAPLKIFQHSNSKGLITGTVNVKGTLYSAPSIWSSILISLIPLTIIIIIFIWYSKRSGGAGNSVFSAGKNKAVRVKSNKRFSDVAGNEEVKAEIEELVDYMKNPAKYVSAGSRIPKGILLGGPPGTGKTLLAKATAGEANVPFYFISGSNFVEMFVGVGASRVRDMFKEARKNAPCIIFIDELDAVGRSRGAGMGGGNDEREQTLNQLLVEMDGISENGGVLIIAATNRSDVLDPALLRPGRFDRIITVNLPDIKEREAILKLHSKGKRLHESINFRNLAKRTPGYSGAQLENVVNEASLLSVRESTGVITPEQVDEAIDRVMAGPAKKNRVISIAELKMVSIHEAGHAVVGLKLKGSDQVQKITIIPRGNAGGYNLMIPEEEKYYGKKFELHAQLASYMGGRAAEEIIYGKDEISNGAANDIQKATNIARKMVAQWGMSDLGPVEYEEDNGSPFLGRDYTKNKNHSDQVGFEIDSEVRKILQNAKEEAVKIIRKNIDLLQLISETLLEKETIVKEEIDYINKYMKKPPKTKITQINKGITDLKSLIKEVKVKGSKTKKSIETKDVIDSEAKKEAPKTDSVSVSAKSSETPSKPKTPKTD